MEAETLGISEQHGRLSVAGSALHSKDKCRKSLKLTSEQLVSCFLISATVLAVTVYA